MHSGIDQCRPNDPFDLSILQHLGTHDVVVRQSNASRVPFSLRTISLLCRSDHQSDDHHVEDVRDRRLYANDLVSGPKSGDQQVTRLYQIERRISTVFSTDEEQISGESKRTAVRF